MSVDLRIELGLTVLVTSRRYRQTNSAQALKETVRVRVRVRGRVRVRVRGGDYFLRLHTPFSIVGVMSQPHSLG